MDAKARLAVVILGVASLAACGARVRDLDDPDGGECSDMDGDGYGVGPGCRGEDCDDTNPEVWVEEQCCENPCEYNPFTRGCSCDPAEFPEPVVCYSGPPETLFVGPCRSGVRECEPGGRGGYGCEDDDPSPGGSWAGCVGEVLPSREICNGVDDDCDGDVDDGVTNACGTCDDTSVCVCAGADQDSPFSVAGGESTRVELDGTGRLRLAGAETQGAYRHVFYTTERVESSANLAWHADVSVGASVGLRARSSYDLDSLTRVRFEHAAMEPPDESPVPLPLRAARFVEVEVLLRAAAPGDGPTVSSLCVGWSTEHRP